MENNNEISKSNKIKIIVITLLIFIVSVAGLSYAYFTIRVTGNEEASSMRLTTANMQLIYTDVQIVSGEYTQPGWTQTKTLTVQNVGNQTVEYAIIWRDLLNEITNGELVISATCTSSVQGNTCNGIDEKIVPTKLTETHNILVKSGISIEPNETHTYTLTALFKETGSNQNYNQNKEFYGTLNIADEATYATPESCFTTQIAGYESVTYDIDLNTCKNYIMTEWGEDESYATSYCTNDIESDLLAANISSSEYSDYGLSNVVYGNSKLAITKYNCSDKDVVIPSTIGGSKVTKIGYKAFYNKYLTSIIIPSGVTEILSEAFRNNQLTSVVIPNGVTSIYSRAFEDNAQLTSLTIPSSMASISSNAFPYTNITTVTISYAPGNPEINNNLLGMGHLPSTATTLTISEGITAIGYSAFNRTPFTSVSIPSSVTEIHTSAFENVPITSITIPPSVTTIEYKAFYNTRLTSVTIPPSVTTIEGQAFDRYSAERVLKSVTIEGKSSSSDFTIYGSNIWGWANDVTCVINNTSNVTNGCITWTGSN